jgi:hypothetical protein
MHHLGRTIMVSQFSLRKSSANYLAPRVFAQKGNGLTIFGHFFCPFSEIFLTLVQSFSEKITKLFYKICIKNESIMQRLKKGTTDGDFSAQKKLKKRNQVLKNVFYVFRTKPLTPERFI